MNKFEQVGEESPNVHVVERKRSYGSDPRRSPPVNRQTDRQTYRQTFPQAMYAGGNKKI